MYPLSTLLFLTLSVVTNIHALPLQSLQGRDLASCQDPHAGFDPSCWDILRLTDYVTNWNKTTPVCPPGPTRGNCCGATEAWTTCFLRMNQPASGSDCTTISSCAFSPSLALIPDGSNMTAQAHYLVFNIYALNRFFSTWYTAMAYATTQAGLAVDGIIQDVDPNKKASGLKEQILTGLIAGFAFLAGPEAAVVGQAAATAAKVLVTALQQAPGVVQALWPSGTTDTQNWQMANLKDTLGSLDKDIRSRIDDALQLVMTDPPTFLAFAANGQFSMPSPPSLDEQTDSLDQALKTYLLSKALDANAYQVVLQIGENRQQHHGAAQADCDFYTSTGVCNGDSGLWHSNNSNADYFLNPKAGTIDRSQSVTITKDAFEKEYSSGRALFDAAATCNGLWDTPREAWKDGLTVWHPYPRPEGVQLFSVSRTGIDFSCLSQLTVFLQYIK
ncbi:MAG: hypothetical protein Q9220_002955 [cf. Caloplaca sp. 1 TL-2023]